MAAPPTLDTLTGDFSQLIVRGMEKHSRVSPGENRHLAIRRGMDDYLALPLIQVILSYDRAPHSWEREASEQFLNRTPRSSQTRTIAAAYLEHWYGRQSRETLKTGENRWGIQCDLVSSIYFGVRNIRTGQHWAFCRELDKIAWSSGCLAPDDAKSVPAECGRVSMPKALTIVLTKKDMDRNSTQLDRKRSRIVFAANPLVPCIEITIDGCAIGPLEITIDGCAIGPLALDSLADLAPFVFYKRYDFGVDPQLQLLNEGELDARLSVV